MEHRGWPTQFGATPRPSSQENVRSLLVIGNIGGSCFGDPVEDELHAADMRGGNADAPEAVAHPDEPAHDDGEL
eukprot:678341-Pyramimonas_sp.AAC.1